MKPFFRLLLTHSHIYTKSKAHTNVLLMKESEFHLTCIKIMKMRKKS